MDRHRLHRHGAGQVHAGPSASLSPSTALPLSPRNPPTHAYPPPHFPLQPQSQGTISATLFQAFQCQPGGGCFTVDLPLLLECLQVFGAASLQNTMLTMAYEVRRAGGLGMCVRARTACTHPMTYAIKHTTLRNTARASGSPPDAGGAGCVCVHECHGSC